MKAEEAQALLDAYPDKLPDQRQIRDALHTVVALTLPRPEKGTVMTAEDAREILDRLGKTPRFPLTDQTFQDALTSIIHLFSALRHALPYTYEPCDQTVSCTECGQVWWDQDTDLDGNWHAPGCKLFEAMVMVGISKDERDPADKVPAPNPDNRTQAMKTRDLVLSAWFSKLAHMAYNEEEPVPEGMDRATWQKAVGDIMHRLQTAKETLPTHGPYAGAKP